MESFDADGPSWTRTPTPWPRLWLKASPCPTCLDEAAGGSVHVGAGHARLDAFDGFLDGCRDDRVDLAQLLVRLTDPDGACQVGAVAVVARTHVDNDRLALADDALTRLMVWAGGVSTGGDDGWEGGPFGAELNEGLMDAPCDIPFCLAGLDCRRDSVKGFAGDLKRLAQQRDL